MREIVGNTIATPNPRPDWNQQDSTKADYIKNKPELGLLAAHDEVARDFLSVDVKESLAKADTAENVYETKIQVDSQLHPACFTAFDILYYEDHPVTDLPLTERKELLQKVILTFLLLA